jgi:hypothetical protein
MATFDKILCPNHGCPLDLGGAFPVPQKGVGICPVSGAEFSFQATYDENKTIKLKDGTLVKQPVWEISGSE